MFFHNMLKKVKVLTALVSSLLSLMIVLGVVGWYMLNSKNHVMSTVSFEIQKGASLRQVVKALENQQLIQYPVALLIYSRLGNSAGRIQAGEYELQPQQSALQILQTFVDGKTIQYYFTIIEGWSIRDLSHAIAKDSRLVKTLDLDNYNTLAKQLSFEEQHPEGLFFPDTYAFTKDTTDKELLLRSYQRLKSILAEEWQNRQTDLPLKTPYEALTLASIIEKETGAAHERPLIAGVFINRLRKGMRLQTDPTVIYGLGESYDGDIRFRDLRTDTPYNTYTRHGLTPTPIAMSGKAAIHAALNPLTTDAYYFVATGAGGEHYFSATLAEHEAAVDRYQRKKSKK